MTDPTPTPPKSSIVMFYEPPGEEPRQWELDRASWTIGESKLVERVYGKTRPEFFADVAEGSDTARTMLVWITRLRTEPDLLLEELDDLLVSYLSIGVTTEEAPEGEEQDPEPDGVTDPKDTPLGSSEKSSGSKTEPTPKLAASHTG